MSRFSTVNFWSKEQKLPPVVAKPTAELDCMHRGSVVGIAECGCAGKHPVYQCNLLQGHCTVTATGKPWLKLHNGTPRQGNLAPCLVCPKRNALPAKQLLNKTIPFRHYITSAELTDDAIDMISGLPPISGVAGIPRSGQLAAPAISTYLSIPLYSASDQYGLQPVGAGGRGNYINVNPDDPILVIDDTVSKGNAMKRIKAKLPKGNYIFAAVYASPEFCHHVDYFGAHLQHPHLLEWNLANTGYISGLSPTSDFGGDGIAIDFDGVLCKDPPRIFNENDVRDKTAYLEWIANAPLARFIPRMFEVPLIVSYRCEYTREATEAWLDKHRIKYKELRLWPHAPNARPFDGQWKANAYLEKNYGLFVESDAKQANFIAKATGKQVLCTDTRKICTS